MDNFLDKLKKYFENTPEGVAKEVWAKYDTKENNIGPAVESIIKDSISTATLVEQIKGVIGKFQKQRQGKEQQEEQWANRWNAMSGAKITGKQFQESIKGCGINVEIITSEFVEDGKGQLLRRKEAIILQINKATLDLIRQEKDRVETFDSLQLTILPIDLAIDWDLG